MKISKKSNKRRNGNAGHTFRISDLIVGDDIIVETATGHVSVSLYADDDGSVVTHVSVFARGTAGQCATYAGAEQKRMLSRSMHAHLRNK